jgi:hypothetical protein
VYAAYLGSEPMGLKSIAKLLNDRSVPTRSMIAERHPVLDRRCVNVAGWRGLNVSPAKENSFTVPLRDFAREVRLVNHHAQLLSVEVGARRFSAINASHRTSSSGSQSQPGKRS